MVHFYSVKTYSKFSNGDSQVLFNTYVDESDCAVYYSGRVMNAKITFSNPKFRYTKGQFESIAIVPWSLDKGREIVYFDWDNPNGLYFSSHRDYTDFLASKSNLEEIY